MARSVAPEAPVAAPAEEIVEAVTPTETLTPTPAPEALSDANAARIEQKGGFLRGLTKLFWRSKKP